MKKVKKMAEGGIPDLSGMLKQNVDQAKQDQLTLKQASVGGGGGGGGSAMDGLGTVNQGASAIGSALGRASEAIGGGGGGGYTSPYKRGGKVTTTRRISTGERSKKSSNW